MSVCVCEYELNADCMLLATIFTIFHGYVHIAFVGVETRSAVKLRTILPFGLTNWTFSCLHCRELAMASAA